MEEEIVDVYFPLTKNSMQKHQQYYPTLGGVMDPIVCFFESKDGLSCMATIYGYERHLTSSYDDRYEEGQDLWFTIIELLLGFVGTMRRSHEFEFELYAYGVADDERKFKWILHSTGHEIPAEKVYSQFPKKYVTLL